MSQAEGTREQLGAKEMKPKSKTNHRLVAGSPVEPRRTGDRERRRRGAGPGQGSLCCGWGWQGGSGYSFKPGVRWALPEKVTFTHLSCPNFGLNSC